jgi:hypothetical protein
MKIFWLLALVIVIILVSREVMLRNITYVVPDGFRGFINVVEKPTSDNKLSVSLKGVIVEVPASGRVEVQSINILRKWNLVSAQFESGEEIEVRIPNVHDEVGFAFWMMGVPSGERLYSFIGTRDEMREFVKEQENRIYRSPPLDHE